VSELTLENVQGKDEKVRYLTGLSSCIVLSTLFKSLTRFQMVIINLMRLRLNLPELFLAYEFSTSQTIISRMFSDVIDVLYARTKPFVFWPE